MAPIALIDSAAHSSEREAAAAGASPPVDVELHWPHMQQANDSAHVAGAAAATAAVAAAHEDAAEWASNSKQPDQQRRQQQAERRKETAQRRSERGAALAEGLTGSMAAAAALAVAAGERSAHTFYNDFALVVDMHKGRLVSERRIVRLAKLLHAASGSTSACDDASAEVAAAFQETAAATGNLVMAATAAAVLQVRAHSAAVSVHSDSADDKQQLHVAERSTQ